MMFVISKELVKSEEFSFSYNGLKINNTTGYKYLGWHIDQTLNLSDRFEKTYKKISSHLGLLSIPLSNLRKKSNLARLSNYDCSIVFIQLYCEFELYQNSNGETTFITKKSVYIIHSVYSATEDVVQKCLHSLKCKKKIFIILFIRSTVLELETKVFCSLIRRLKLRLPDLPSLSWV